MSVALESNAFFWGIEYLATFCCGMCGGLAAVRKGYDIFAILVTTWLTALGGGIIRDVLLGIAPPVGVSDKGLVIVALLASVAVAVCHPEINRLKWSMLSLDALALGLYAVNGTSKAMMWLPYWTCWSWTGTTRARWAGWPRRCGAGWHAWLAAPRASWPRCR